MLEPQLLKRRMKRVGLISVHVGPVHDENRLDPGTQFSSVGNLSVTASCYLLLYTTLTDINKNWFCHSDSLSSLDCMHDFVSAGLDRFQTARKSSSLFSPLASRASTVASA